MWKLKKKKKKKSVWGMVRPACPAMATDIVKAESAGILWEGLVGEHGQGCGADLDKCVDEIKTVWYGESSMAFETWNSIPGLPHVPLLRYFPNIQVFSL